jgi:hypothetical protein
MLNNKFRIPEMALGALFASLLWAGIWGWSDSYAPSEKQKQECQEAAQKSGAKTDECKSLWERTTSDPIALYTFGVFIFTGVLGVSTLALWQVTRVAAFAAKDSAEIARRSLTELERPWLFIEGAKITRRELPNEPIKPNDWFITFTCKNVRRSPAVIKECIIKLEDRDTLPPKPNYADAVPHETQRWAPPNVSFETRPAFGPVPDIATKNGRPHRIRCVWQNHL